MFLGIFEAIKPHQANTAMCDQRSCPTAFLHTAAEHQQLKASWGVTAETQAARTEKKKKKNEQSTWSHPMKAGLGDFTCLQLQTTHEITVWKNWASIGRNLVHISELQTACVPNQTLCRLITEAKEWREANDLTLVTLFSLLIRTTFNPDWKELSFLVQLLLCVCSFGHHFD